MKYLRLKDIMVVAMIFAPFAAHAHDEQKLADLLSEQVIYPSVLIGVESKNGAVNMTGVGSGTLIYSPTPEAKEQCIAARVAIKADEKECSFPLAFTTYHNFIPVPGKDSGQRTPGIAKRPDIKPDTFNASVVLVLPDREVKQDGVRSMPVPISVIAYDKKKDLALIRIDIEDTVPYVARLASKQSKLRLGNRVWVSGFPQGVGPYVDDKILSNASETCEETDVGEACRLLLLSSNMITFGVSGGGLYQLSDGGFEYVGMVEAMGPVPNLTYSIHVSEIHAFFERNGFGFLIPKE